MAIATDITKDRDVEIHLDGDMHYAVKKALARIKDPDARRRQIHVRIRPESGRQERAR